MKVKVKLKDKQINHMISVLENRYYLVDKKKDRKTIRKILKKLDENYFN